MNIACDDNTMNTIFNETEYYVATTDDLPL